MVLLDRCELNMERSLEVNAGLVVISLSNVHHANVVVASDLKSAFVDHNGNNIRTCLRILI